MHVVLSVIMAGIALQLWLPTDTFGGSANWRAIARHLTEDELGILCWAVACVGALGVATSSRLVQLASVAVLATAHGLMAGAFLVSNPAGIGSLLLGGFAVEGYYLTYRRFAGGVR